MIRFALPILAIIIVVCSACTPSIRVQRLAPAAINLGPLRHIEVLAVEGRPGESQQALALLHRQATADDWFSITEPAFGQKEEDEVAMAGTPGIEPGARSSADDNDARTVAGSTGLVAQGCRIRTALPPGKRRECLRLRHPLRHHH